MKKLIPLLTFFLTFQLSAQNLSIEPSITPEFFKADETITINYDVTGTYMHDWTEAWLWLWLPDNASSNISSNVNPASSNTSLTNRARFSKTVIDGKQILTISIVLTDFTGEPKEEIKEVGMLIKGNDWSDGQSIDYLTSVSEGFELRLKSPESNYKFYTSSELINVEVLTSENATIEYYIDGGLISTVSDVKEFETTHQIIDDGGVHHLRITANNGVETLERGFSYTMNPTTPQLTMPTGLIEGINYHSSNTSVTLVLLAPNKQNVFVLGDFNDWLLNEDYLMYQDGERFWLTIDNLIPQREYIFQYLIDGNILVADPYTDKVSDPWDDKYIEASVYPDLIEYPDTKTNFRASVFQTGQEEFAWQVNNFIPPKKEDLVIYELLVRDFDEDHSYKAVIDRLDYLQELGINALELMPVNEFEGNNSWGYNPNFYFAPDKYYGTKNDLKRLIDECHVRGIAVILDMVLNHSFNSSPLARMYWNDNSGRPAADNPWYNENHNFQNTAAHWGSDFNHESTYTQNFIDSVNRYWVNEYKVDGFRFDFTKGFGNNYKSNSDSWGSNYDADRIALLKRMTDKIWENNNKTYVIFEHLAENVEEQELANYGILLWGNLNHSFRNLGKGNSGSIIGLTHTYRGWDDPNLIGYMESHDEERVAWDVFKTFDLKRGVQRLKLNASFFFTVPGPKMVWQFGEMGYDEELNNDRLGIKPTHWEYLEDPIRKDLVAVYTSLINLKTNTNLFDPEYFTWNVNSSIKYINVNHPDTALVVIGNFSNSSESTNAHFTKNGVWYDYFSGEQIDVQDFENQEIVLSAGDFRIFSSVPIENYVEGNPGIYITGLDTNAAQSTIIFPNPIGHRVKIKSDLSWTHFSIRDLSGRLILNGDLIENSADLSLVNSGIYVLVIETNNGEFLTKRIIKK